MENSSNFTVSASTLPFKILGSKVTEMLQNIYLKSCFPEKYEGAQLFLTFIIVKNVS